MAETKDFRHGHRERVRARFLREGLTPFEDYEVLELLLFYAIPRRDTKGQAHALDDYFGSLYATMTASEADICRVPGIGASTARFLRAIFPFMRYVAREEPHLDLCHTEKELAERAYPHLERECEMSSSLLLMNNRDEVIRSFPLGKGKGLTLIGVRDIASLAFAYRASTVAITDYKESGIPFVDPMLSQGVGALIEDLDALGVQLRDYILVTDAQYNSYFFSSGAKRLRASSPYFLLGNIPKKIYIERSHIALAQMLSFVTSKEKAEALAHDLLDTYGTLANLFSIPYEMLLAEHKNAKAELLYLNVISEAYSRIWLSYFRSQKGIVFKNAREVGDMFSNAIGMNTEETLALAMLDEKMHLIDLVICARGSVNTATYVTRNLIETALARRAAYIAVGHNHPCGVAVPSFADTRTTVELFRSAACVKIGFVDHFVVTSSDSFPMSRRSDLSAFTDMENSFYEK